MSNNILNDISKVYLNSIAESAVPGKPAEKLGAVSGIPQSEQDAARQRTLAKAAAIRAKKGITQEALDPVGKEDADIDNDGKSNTKKDKYLMHRRNVIKKELATQKEAKEVKRWWDDDGDGIGYEKGEVEGKFKKKKKSVKECYSNWREDLSEVITDKEINKKISEKKVNNKIVINPKLNIGEVVQNLGGELIEMIEIEEKTLTAPETKKKEEIVKSMKKNLSGFKSRYGDRATEVMYATATKQAKKVAEAVSTMTPAQQLVQQPTIQTAQTPNPAVSASLKLKIAAQKKELMARKAQLSAQQSQLAKGVALTQEENEIDEGKEEAQERRFQKRGHRSEGESITHAISKAATARNDLRNRLGRMNPESPKGKQLKSRSAGMSSRIEKLQKARQNDTSTFRQGRVGSAKPE
tara:strand:- start:4061 stop:5290 length:1230 start_codon:yes stop_codon:yes gene_type:complete